MSNTKPGLVVVVDEENMPTLVINSGLARKWLASKKVTANNINGNIFTIMESSVERPHLSYEDTAYHLGEAHPYVKWLKEHLTK